MLSVAVAVRVSRAWIPPFPLAQARGRAIKVVRRTIPQTVPRPNSKRYDTERSRLSNATPASKATAADPARPCTAPTASARTAGTAGTTAAAFSLDRSHSKGALCSKCQHPNPMSIAATSNSANAATLGGSLTSRSTNRSPTPRTLKLCPRPHQAATKAARRGWHWRRSSAETMRT